MRPESASAIIRPGLQALINEYNTEGAGKKFIGRRAAPVFRSPNSTGDFPIFRRAGLKKRVDTKRASGAQYAKVTMEWGKATFSTDDHGLEHVVDEREKLKYINLFDAEAAATRQVNALVMLDHEYRASQLYANAGLTNTDVTTAWSTSATAVPLTDISNRMDSVCDGCGASPSDLTIVIPRADFREMLSCTQVIDKSKYTFPGVQPAFLDEMQVAAMLGVKQVLVPSGVYDSTEEDVAETNSQLWAAGVIYVAVLAEEDDPLDIQSAFRTVLWNDYCAEFPTMESYDIENIKSVAVRARLDTDEIMLGEADLFASQLTNT